jgi:hypothetical protein
MNEVTVQDVYPLHRVMQCQDIKVVENKDLCSGFWQIEMDEGDKR